MLPLNNFISHTYVWTTFYNYIVPFVLNYFVTRNLSHMMIQLVLPYIYVSHAYRYHDIMYMHVHPRESWFLNREHLDLGQSMSTGRMTIVVVPPICTQSSREERACVRSCLFAAENLDVVSPFQLVIWTNPVSRPI